MLHDASGHKVKNRPYAIASGKLPSDIRHKNPPSEYLDPLSEMFVNITRRGELSEIFPLTKAYGLLYSELAMWVVG